MCYIGTMPYRGNRNILRGIQKYIGLLQNPSFINHCASWCSSLSSAKYQPQICQPQPHIASSEDFLFFFLFFFISYSRREVNQLQSMLTLRNTKALHQNKNIWGQSCFMNTQIINSSCVLPVATSATQAVLLVCLLVWDLFCVSVYLDIVLHSSVEEFACRHIWFFEKEELRRSINIYEFLSILQWAANVC